MNREVHWLRVEQRVGIGLRVLYALLALWLWRGEGGSGSAMPPFWWGYITLAALAIPAVLLLRPSRGSGILVGFLQVLDALFIAYTIHRAPGVVGPAVWLFVPWIGKQALLAAALPAWSIMAFLVGPLLLVVAYLRVGAWTFVMDEGFQQTYVVLLLVALLGGGMGLYMHHLRQVLAQERADLASKTEILQRTASDLGARVLELRALQEVAHHLSMSLHLEETLAVIGQRARELFGARHAAILVAEEDGTTWRWGYVDGDTSGGESLPSPSMFILPDEDPAHVRVLTVRNRETPHPLARALRPLWGNLDLIVIPLITRGRQVALLVLGCSEEELAFGERQEQLAESFAFLAATAIENARLYENVLEQRQELEAVLKGIGDAVVVTDPELTILLANPVAVRTLRLPSSPEGQNLAHAVTNDDFLDLIRRAFKDEGDVIVEDVTFEFPGEKPRTFQAVTSAVRGHTRAARAAVTVLRDVTAQKELERMKSNFLSVVSHELKTPLHSIKGFVEIIRMGKAGPITDLQADFLTTVKEQTQVLQRMIDDLLVFSRLETGRLRLHIEDVSLAAIAAGVVQKLTPLAEEKSLHLETRIPDDFPDVEGDYMRLEQVLTNLVENAIKFTPAGGRVLIDGQDLGERVRVWVADTGIGIPESERERIFDRFYQVDASERRAYRGAGLGLTICKHIVLRHHGHIWVESAPGEGSTFYVELPKKQPPIPETLDFYTEASPG